MCGVTGPVACLPVYSPSLERAVYDEVSPDGKDVSFTLRLKGDGWVGFGTSTDGTMNSGGKGSDIVACQDGGLVRRHRLTQRSWPGGDGAEVPGGTCAHEDGPSVVLSFTLPAAEWNFSTVAFFPSRV